MSGFEKRRSSEDMSSIDPPVRHKIPSTEIEKEALIWLQLLTSGEPRAWDLKGFKRWLHLNPAHRSTFNEVKRRWDQIQLPEGATRPTLTSVGRDASDGWRRAAAFKPGRRAWLGAAVSAAAVVGVAAIYPPLGLWPALSTWGADERTAVGEQRTLGLARNASVTLNTRTSIRRQLIDGEVIGLDLITGEAAIDLNGAGQLFAVAAGVGRSLAESGHFEVRNLQDKVCVTCIEGVVRVEHPAGSHTLRSRQQVVYDASMLSGIASIEPTQVSAWRNGELLFNQTRLVDVIEEVNRYRPGRVVLINDDARNKPVNGRFAIASLDLALIQLQHAFGLTARSLPGQLLILS